MDRRAKMIEKRATSGRLGDDSRWIQCIEQCLFRRDIVTKTLSLLTLWTALLLPYRRTSCYYG